MAEDEKGKFHACKGNKTLDQVMVSAVTSCVTSSDKWIADKFIKRLAMFRYLYPRALIRPELFINGTYNARKYLAQCSNTKFRNIMRTGSL